MASLPIQLVSGPVPDTLMPKKGDPLTREQIGLLRAWIDRGYRLGSGKLAWQPKRFTGRSDPRSSVHRSRLLAGRKAAFTDPVDAFVAAPSSMEKKLTLSLTHGGPAGVHSAALPGHARPDFLPEPEAVRQFVEDRRSDAVEKLVDRVLASSRYGERWARHWLDIARLCRIQRILRRTVNAKTPTLIATMSFSFLNDDKPYADQRASGNRRPACRRRLGGRRGDRIFGRRRQRFGQKS